jgi:uncharacterized protein YcgI (DUF1989 family)
MNAATRIDVPPGAVLWEEVIPGGCHWSGVVRRGVALRLTDVEGGANGAMLLFNHEERFERYSMPDTLKAQHTAYLTKGNVLYTDMGRAIASVIEDTCGWHDTICGVMDDATLESRFGRMRYQEHRNAMTRSGLEGFLKELVRLGLNRRDLHANVNWQGGRIGVGRSRVRAGVLETGCVRGLALRHACAGGAVHLSASARPGHGMDTEAPQGDGLALRPRRTR